MSSTLGEKLRQARSERGISISEVAEQTRISPLYLEAIDADNYKTLPGGIFNKGFVRSYAKYVGLDEQEALHDYSQLIAEHEAKEDDKYKAYRPEVLTDDRSASSFIPTVIFAVVILALMTAGILFLVSYIQNQPSEPEVVTNLNSSRPANANTNAGVPPAASDVPAMSALKVEFAAVGDAVSLTSVMDSGKRSEVLLAPGNPMVFEPKESLRLAYHKSRAEFAQLRINGKQITLPSQPENPRAPTIEIDINSGNLAKFWQSGSISYEAAEPTPQTDGIAVTAPTPASARPAPKTVTLPKPAPANTNADTPPTVPAPTMTNRAPTMTGRPPANTNRPN